MQPAGAVVKANPDVWRGGEGGPPASAPAPAWGLPLALSAAALMLLTFVIVGVVAVASVAAAAVASAAVASAAIP